MISEKTYQMLWNCPFCSTRGLLGVTHRHCPNCGAPQDPSKRYFPPDDQKVAVEDHKYSGADVVCPSCDVAIGRAAKHCGSCGSPLDGGKDVRLQPTQVIPDKAPPHPVPPPVPPPVPFPTTGQLAKPKGTGCNPFGCLQYILYVLLAIILASCCDMCSSSDAVFKVVGHSWTHEIAIESYEMSKDTSPCSKMPSSAQLVSRQAREPECETQKIDQGDGTYKERRECKEQEALCTYKVGKWKSARTEKNSGRSVNDSPTWPSVRLSRTGTCEGCEREGAKTATYDVLLENTTSGGSHTCSFQDVSKWRSYKVGSTWNGSVSLFGVNCGSLSAQ